MRQLTEGEQDTIIICFVGIVIGVILAFTILLIPLVAQEMSLR